MKRCAKCHITKPTSAFRLRGDRNDKPIPISYCRPCSNRLLKDRRRQNHYPAKYHKELREAALRAYGKRCACCGEAEEAFLLIDHVNRDGQRHRRTIGRHIYAWLKRQGYPKDRFRVLCFNCNMGNAWGRTCPHIGEHSSVVLAEAP